MERTAERSTPMPPTIPAGHQMDDGSPPSRGTARGHFAICTIDVSTAALTVVTDDAIDAFYPAWSPDGDIIVFTRETREPPSSPSSSE